MRITESIKAASLPDLNHMIKILEVDGGVPAYQKIADSLRQGEVVLLRGIDGHRIDNIIEAVVDQFNLRAELELQAGFATVKGHRESLSKYFMTVNKRDPFQCIPPHSEGGSFANMQLVSLYCYENTTDGGETVLLNLDEAVDLQQFVRERVKRGKVDSQQLSAGDISRIKMQYSLHLPDDLLRKDDMVLREQESGFPGLKVIDALAMPRKTWSKVLQKEVIAFWSTMKSTKSNLNQEFIQHLREWGVYREQPSSEGPVHLEPASYEISNYEQIFKGKIIYRLAPGELIIMNNHTWVHAASNWTSNSGCRNIAVAIA